MIKDTIQDTKAFGGTPIFVLLAIVTFTIGQSELALQIIIGYVVAYALTAIIRMSYFRERPEPRAHSNFFQKVDASSFPSLHAMRAATLATIFSIFFDNSLLTLFFALVAIAVAMVRVYQKRHHKSDVVVGLIFGVAVGIAAVWLAEYAATFI